MLNNMYNNPTMADVRQILKQPEGPQLEYLTTVPSYTNLAIQIQAFANAKGGVILVGVKEVAKTHGEIQGCDYANLSRIYDRALEQLRQVPDLRVHKLEVNGVAIGVIAVRPFTPGVVESRFGTYIRDQNAPRPMTAAEIQQKVQPMAQQDAIQTLASAVESNTRTIDQLRRELAFAQSWRGQWKGLVLSWVVGAVLGFLASFLANHFKLIPWLDMHEKPSTPIQKQVPPNPRPTATASSTVRTPTRVDPD